MLFFSANQTIRAFAAGLMLAFSLSLSAHAAAPIRVATVLYVAGQVEARAATTRLLSVGDAVHEGEILQTAADGHLYLRTVDQGFFALRPATRVQVETYQYDPAQPAASRIRITLQTGVMRAVSGLGAQAARDKYRLETPVAAIGLRGTDYTVFTDATLTRVSVQSGAVIVGALGQGCAAGAAGPCPAAAAVELAANQPDRLIEVRSATLPRLLEAPAGSSLRPERISPPLPNEKAVGAEGQPGKAGARDDSLLPTQRETSLNQIVASPGDGPLAHSTLHWGRWKSVAGMPAGRPVGELLGAAGQLQAVNSFYVVGRDAGAPPFIPGNGQLSFQLNNAEAVVSRSSGRITPASLENGFLTIDLGTRRFATGFDLLLGNERLALQTPGTLTKDGALVSDLRAPGANLSVNGVLGNQSREAAYLFTGRIGSERTAQGVTYWTR